MLSNAVFSWKHIQTHTLDKNGSLYDPAGTESWNMQIRYETTKLTKHPTNNRSSPEWFPCPVKDWAGTWIERPQSISLCNRCVFVGWRHLKHTPSPCIKIRKGEDKGRKREKFYIYLDVTHTHTPGRSRVNPERQEEEKSGHTTGRRPKTAQGGEGNRRTSGTNLHGETDLTKTAHTPKPHDTLRRGTRGKIRDKMGD